MSETHIITWETDPGSRSQPDGGALISLPTPDINSTSLPTSIDMNAPKPRVYSPGTLQFLYWNLASALHRGSEFWAGLLPEEITWQMGKSLPVQMDKSLGLKSKYTRQGLLFFSCARERQVNTHL